MLVQLILVNLVFLIFVFGILGDITILDGFLNWCAKRHYQRNQFLYDYSVPVFDGAPNLATSILLFSTYTVVISQIFISFSVAAYSWYSGEYILALPYWIPGLKPTSVFTYSINSVHQLAAAVQESYFYGIMLSFVNVLPFYMTKQAVLIKMIIRNFTDIRNRSSFDAWLKIVIDTTEDLKL